MHSIGIILLVDRPFPTFFADHYILASSSAAVRIYIQHGEDSEATEATEATGTEEPPEFEVYG